MSVEWLDDGGIRRGPSWPELVNQAARLLGFDDPDLLRVRGSDLQILEYYRDQNNGSAALLTNWLVKTQNPPNDALQESRIHEQLVALDKCDLFYTTNYDDFIERSFKSKNRPHRVVANESEMGGSAEGAEIVKFHGDWNHPDAMVLSESDYEKRLKLATEMDCRFRSDVLGRGLLFIGYSFSDWNVSYLFRLINEQFGELPVSLSGKRAYIVVSDPSDFERHLFKTRKIEVIAIDGARRTDEVASLLEELRN